MNIPDIDTRSPDFGKMKHLDWGIYFQNLIGHILWQIIDIPLFWVKALPFVLIACLLGFLVL